MRTAILGGGIAGLTAAYRLARRGVNVTLFEATDKLGGLGGWFDYDGHRLDKWYHVLLDSDDHLLGLLGELNLRERIDWAETTMGFIVNNKHYPFNTAVDLLKFKALNPFDRIRTGMAALYITKVLRNGKPLDQEPACKWLVRIFGRRVYESIWEPLLIAKFGDMRDRVPAYWVWNTLNREKNGSQEVKGYVRGGNAVIVDRLVEEIEKAGGRIQLSTPVTAISSDADGATLDVADAPVRFDNVLCTLPFSRLSKIADDTLLAKIPQSTIDYQGVVNVMLVTRKRLSRHYWTAVVNSDLPFQGVVETTHVVRPDSIGKRHLIYTMNYCRPDSDLYKRGDALQVCDAIEGLARLYPDFSEDHVDDAFVFRAPYVEPVWPCGYLDKRPEAQVAGTRVFLATTAQAYPMVTSWNTSIKLADDAVSAMTNQNAAPSAPPRPADAPVVNT
ncbi:MAG: FAD-dependent oxidoreductase [Phycisphaerales bacterium]|nr:FAD-dependent oxidoreductase [Phycisphaerales bacterium]